MNDFSILPNQVEECIRQLIDQRFQEENLYSLFPNRLLREDVLDLLDRYCTVVYYPLEGEGNNGFRVKDIPFADGSRHDFVFINTAQTLEKQAFTAAHELGHIWSVDQHVIDRCKLSPDDAEPVINRFAAVLLMPKDEFRKAVHLQLAEYTNPKDNSITYVNLIKVVVHLMNQFFAPRKAVMLRLVETGFFRIEAISALLKDDLISAEFLDKLEENFINEFGYVKLKNPSPKKWIKGLAEKLDIAEKNHLLSENKIRQMRERFGLTTAAEVSPEMNQSLSLESREGLESS